MPKRFKLPPYRVRYTLTAEETGQIVPWGVTYLGIPAIHTKTKGKGISVAVLDTGIDDTHHDFSGAITALKDFTGSSSGTKDHVGHGTHTAGTIAARDNGQGIIGIAPECSLIIGKVLGDDGSGDSSGIAAGIRWATDCGAQIISMSLGSPDGDSAIQAALQYAVDKGVIVVAAAGNDGMAGVGYPAAWDTLSEAIAANDEQGRIASFSSVGPQVDACAPGTQILSCWPGNRYSRLDGTSMATPHVSGGLALVQAYRKAHGLPLLKSQADFDVAVHATAKTATPSGPSPSYGYGLVNVAGMLNYGLPPVPAPTYPPDQPSIITNPIGQLPAGYTWNIVGTPIHHT